MTTCLTLIKGNVMNYIEKAIEKYREERQEYYAKMVEEEVSKFSVVVWKIGVDGKCPGDILCRQCPMNIAFMSTSTDKHCGVITFEERRELVLSTVKE